MATHQPEPVMYRRPRLKPGVTFAVAPGGVDVEYRGDQFRVELDEEAKIARVAALLGRVDGTSDVAALASGSGLGDDEVTTLLELLDEQFCVVEGWSPAFEGSSGTQFLGELEDLFHCTWKREAGQSELSAMVFEGRAPRDVLVGWAFENYHVTRRAHDCLAPVITRSYGAVRERLARFFREEYRHDKLMANSLLAFGFTAEEVAQSVPLPYTAAAMNLLAKWARTDVLSFMAGIFVFEGSEAAGDAYIDALRSYDLPSGFVEGQAAHNDINAGEHHGNVSRELYAFVDYVSPGEKRRVIANLRILFETFERQHEEALAYYSAPRFGIPRRLAPVGEALAAC